MYCVQLLEDDLCFVLNNIEVAYTLCQLGESDLCLILCNVRVACV